MLVFLIIREALFLNDEDEDYLGDEITATYDRAPSNNLQEEEFMNKTILSDKVEYDE